MTSRGSCWPEQKMCINQHVAPYITISNLVVFQKAWEWYSASLVDQLIELVLANLSTTGSKYILLNVTQVSTVGVFDHC
jgi:hypothetical protein